MLELLQRLPGGRCARPKLPFEAAPLFAQVPKAALRERTSERMRREEYTKKGAEGSLKRRSSPEGED